MTIWICRPIREQSVITWYLPSQQKCRFEIVSQSQIEQSSNTWHLNWPITAFVAGWSRFVAVCWLIRERFEVNKRRAGTKVKPSSRRDEMEASQEENGEKKEDEEKPAVCCCFNCGARCGVYDGDLCVRCKELRACRFCRRHLPEVCFGCDASQDVCEVRFFLFFVSNVIYAYFHVKNLI